MSIKLMKKNSQYLLGLFLVIIVIITLSYFYIISSWSNYITQNELDKLITEIQTSEKLPSKFYELYEVAHPNSLKFDSKRHFFNAIFSGDFEKSPSFMIVQMNRLGWKNVQDIRFSKFYELGIAQKLEEKTSQEECLNYILKNETFKYNAKGAKQAALVYFKKELHQLNERELAGLIVIMENPRYFDPITRKDLHSEAVDKIINQ